MILSACLMVKNEEEMLPRCLDSIKDVVDEIIIVDTGSSDRTIEIAQSYGAKIYHHPWEYNFSLHRNQSIGYASGDWLLIIDADEKVILAEGVDKDKIKNWLAKLTETSPETNGVLFEMVDFKDGMENMICNSARLFRSGSIHYVNPVHNQPVFEGMGVLCQLFKINHYGYGLSPEKMEAKFHRIESMLLKELENNPSNTQTAFYLSQLYGQFGLNEKCIEWGEKYVSIRESIHPNFSWSIYFSLIMTYLKLDFTDKAYQMIKNCLKEKPTDPDICYALSEYGAKTGNNVIMAEGSRRFVDGYYECFNNPACKGVQFHFTVRPDFLMANLYRLFIASLEEAKVTWDKLAPMLPYLPDNTKQELFDNLQLLEMNDFTEKYRNILSEESK